MYIPTTNGYFSGAGLMEIGILQAGVNIVQSFDLDKEATSTMTKNSHYFSHSVITGDIKLQTVLDQPQSDVAVFTYPCNHYSTIADIHGTRTGDELFLHAFRHIVIGSPEMYVIENVPGMRKFKVVMEAMTKIPGYYVTVFCPVDAANWLPQSRKRLILFGTKKPFNFEAPIVISKKPSIKDLLEKGAEIDLSKSVIARINGEYRDKPIIVDPSDSNAIAPTCVAHYAKDKGTRLVKDSRSKYGLRPFTIREYARLQGVPDDYHFENKVSSYRLIGNGVAVPMGRWVGNQIMRYFN
jgi:DNA (cytosine-5)-methyltransferase 1